jgi:hypothetical protein
MSYQKPSNHEGKENKSENTSILTNKYWYSAVIGFLAGVFAFGMVSWFMSEKRQVGFLIPMSIPIIMIVRMVKAGKRRSDENSSTDGSGE